MKHLFIFLGFIFSAVSYVQSQVAPTIIDFTPKSGPVGTPVTITGTHFNTTVANNVVYFGAVKATVNSATSTLLNVTVPIGATHAPITVSDSTIGLTAVTAQKFIPTFVGSGTITSTTFGNKFEVSTGTAPMTVVVCDFDGDGKVDLAVPNQNSNTISFIRNTSVIGNISFASKIDSGTGTQPFYSIACDIDGDCKPDVAVINRGSNSFDLYRNTSSLGTISFAPKITIQCSNGPAGLNANDFDGDGKIDIAITLNASDSIAVFKNISTIGTFQFNSRVCFKVGTSPFYLTSGDIDLDGKSDLAVTNYNDNNVSLLRNTGTPGTISFASKIDYSTVAFPYGIQIGDLDLDGKPDVVVGGLGNIVTIYPNNSTIGSVSLGTRIDVPYIGKLSGSDIQIADVDGDGKLDIVVPDNSTGGTKVSLFKNTSTTGAISFSSNVDFTIGNKGYGAGIADFDGDGKPDLAITNFSGGNVSILRNSPLLSVISTNPSHNSLNVANNSTITVSFNHDVNTATLAPNAIFIRNDKGKKLSFNTSYSQQNKTLTISPISQFSAGDNITVLITDKVKSISNDSLTHPYQFTFTVAATKSNLSLSVSDTVHFNQAAYHTTAGDFNNDGFLDQAVTIGGNGSGRTIALLTNDGTGNFTRTGTITVGTEPSNVSSGDLDNDGDIDLLISAIGQQLLVFANDGTGSFTPSAAYTIGNEGYPAKAILGDLNGDGWVDIVTSQASSSVKLYFLLNNGDGTFSVPAYLGDYGGYIAKDIDNDGDIDIIGLDNTNHIISVLKNDGTSSFSLTTFSVAFYAGLNNTGAVDVDGDGDCDLIVRDLGDYPSYNNAKFHTYKNDGTGSFTEFSVTTGVGRYPAFISTGDVDADGDFDIVVPCYVEGRVDILTNDGNGTFNINSNIVIASPNGSASGDFDNNGSIDFSIITYESSYGVMSVLKGGVPYSPIRQKLDSVLSYINDTVYIPIKVVFPLDSSYSSIEAKFSGFKNQLEFLGIDTTGTMFGTHNWTYEVNGSDSAIILASAGSSDISGDGVVFKLKFRVTGSPCTFASIYIDTAVFDTGEDSVVTIDGGVAIKAIPAYGDVDESGQVQAFDASLVLKYILESYSLDCQAFANADVTANGEVTALDATGILKYVVGLIPSFPYMPPPSPASGILAMSATKIGSQVSIPITLSQVSNIFSFEGKILFDPKHLEFQSVEWKNSVNGFLKDYVVDQTAGVVTIVGSDSQNGAVSGTMANLIFKVVKDTSKTELSISKIRWNESLPLINPAKVEIVTGVETAQNNIPSNYSLSQNFPNPFNPSTTISYDLPKNEFVTMKVYDMLGREVAVLLNEEKSAGSYTVEWNAGHSASGLYIARMRAGDFTKTIKMTMMK